MTLIDAINDGWGWTGVDAAEVLAKSPMGHVLFTDVDGCFHYLDTDGMKLLALGGRDAAEAHFAKDETREIWLAAPLVAAALERLGEPPEGSVFTLEPLAMLEGTYSPDKMCILPHEELIRFSGDAARQLKDLPDGSQFQIRIVE